MSIVCFPRFDSMAEIVAVRIAEGWFSELKIWKFRRVPDSSKGSEFKSGKAQRIFLHWKCILMFFVSFPHPLISAHDIFIPVQNRLTFSSDPFFSNNKY